MKSEDRHLSRGMQQSSRRSRTLDEEEVDSKQRRETASRG